MRLNEFLDKSWTRYHVVTPDAAVIHDLLEARGEKIINDHVAYRTFNIKGMDRLSLGSIFEKWGYKKSPDDLDFPEKKLKASYYLHSDATLPKIFISELILEQFSKDLQNWVRDFTSKALARISKLNPEIFLEPSWKPVSLKEYQDFYETSEYASWTAAFGLQANHFTVFVNALKTFPSLQELNQFLIDNGMNLNSQGGIIKGTPKELLEQSSTMAKRIPWEFANGEKSSVMGCYYEFARRYYIPGTQQYFQGFIPKIADKIFESTFEKHE